LQDIEEHNVPPATSDAADPVAAEEHASPDSNDERSTGGLIDELKRRSVFRVGIAYVAVAWVLLQLGEILFDFLEVPAWSGKLLIVFLALGLPVALFLAWAFELTPEGVKRDKDIDRSRIPVHQSGRKLDYIVIVILAIAVAFFALDKFS
jgi:hypothetical protein